MNQTRKIGYALIVVALSAVAFTTAPQATAAIARISTTPGLNSAITDISEPDAEGTRYVAGSFTAFDSWATGGGALVDSQTGSVNSSFPKVTGNIVASAADGSGGFYIGGTFDAVDGVSRSNLAHINSDGSLDNSWNPNANDSVRSIVVSGSNIYVGGYFTTIGDTTRNGIAAVNNTDGTLTTWNPNPNSYVGSIVVSGSTIYVGGDFTTIGGTTRNYVAAITTDGTLTTWNPNPNSYVGLIAVSGSTIYVSGYFTTIGGTTRNGIAAVNNTDGAVVSMQLPPATPATPVATAQNGDISVAVTKGTAIGGTPSSYVVRSVKDATKSCTVTGSTGSCTVSSLANETSYTFIAVATNDGGSSSASVASNAVTPKPAVVTTTTVPVATTTTIPVVTTTTIPVVTTTTIPKVITPTVKKGKSISFATINKSAKILIPKGATLVLTVPKSSKSKCSVSKTTVKALAVGTCVLSVAVTPRATTKVKKPKTVVTKTKVIVTK